ncbi:MAG: NAD-binding protein [Holosporaceae bacterium]|jgi:trk system potassium uptake protein TrkA|nr:NAD-binding protein [Holosporaceae bacterium]
MKILVLGAGEVGHSIASYLADQGEEVAIVEKSPEVAVQIKESSGIDVIVGNGLDPEVLREARAENADYMIASMSSDEQNIIACKLMGALFAVQTKIARLKSRFFLQNDNMSPQFFRENFAVDVIIQPELEIANAICAVAAINGAFDVINLKGSLIIGLKCREGTEVLNTPFRHFRGIVDYDASVLIITRNGNTFRPQMDDMLLVNDEIYLAVASKHKNESLKLFGYAQTIPQNILMVGGKGLAVAKAMRGKNPEVSLTLLEESMKNAEEIAQNFPEIAISCGNYLDYDFLREISHGIDTAIVVTNSEKNNILVSLFLKKIGVKRVLTLAKNYKYDVLLPVSAGCSVINPSAITVETIVHGVRREDITSVIALKNNHNWVVVEAPVTESCSYLGKGVMSIAAENKIIPIFLSRNIFFEEEITQSSPILAEKDPCMTVGDVVTLLVEKTSIRGVEKIFSSYQFSRDKILS